MSFYLYLIFLVHSFSCQTPYDGQASQAYNQNLCSIEGQISFQFTQAQFQVYDTLHLTLWLRKESSNQVIQADQELFEIGFQDKAGFRLELQKDNDLQLQDKRSKRKVQVNQGGELLDKWTFISLLIDQKEVKLRLYSFQGTLLEKRRSKIESISNLFPTFLTLNSKNNDISLCYRHLKLFRTQQEDIKLIAYQEQLPSLSLVLQESLRNLEEKETNLYSLSYEGVVEESKNYSPQYFCDASMLQKVEIMKFDGSLQPEVIPLGAVSYPFTTTLWFFKQQNIEKQGDELLFQYKNMKANIIESSNYNQLFVIVQDQAFSFDITQLYQTYLKLRIVQESSNSIQVALFTEFGEEQKSYNQLESGEQLLDQNNLLLSKSFFGIIQGFEVHKVALQVDSWSRFMSYSSNISFRIGFGKELDWINKGVFRYQQDAIITKLQIFDKEPPFQSIRKVEQDLQKYEFDGITCKDKKLKLFFDKANQHAQLPFTLPSKIPEQLTLELWLKHESKRGRLLELFSDQTRDPILSTDIELGKLQIRLYFKNIATISLSQVTEENQWQHLAIQVEKKKIQNLSYMQGEENFNENSSIDIQKYMEELQGQFVLFLNKGEKRLGAQRVFFQEFRLWTEKRSLEEIQLQRFQQIHRSMPLLYLKLSLGPDYVERNLNNELEVLETAKENYKEENDLIVCPVNTFYNSQGLCQVEPFTKIQMHTYYKSESKEWVIDFENTSFVTAFSKEYFTDFIRWEISLVDSTIKDKVKFSRFIQAIKEQQSQSILTFPDSLVDESQVYKLRATGESIEGYFDTQIRNFQVIFQSECFLVDKESLQTQVTRIIREEKGEKDLILEFKQDNCQNYILDKLQVSFLNKNLKYSSRDLTPTQFTFTKKLQQKIETNFELKFVITAQFKHKTSTQKLERQLIYQISYQSQIVSVIEPRVQDKYLKTYSKQFFFLFQQKMQINTQKTHLSNAPRQTPHFFITYFCPKVLSQICETSNANLDLPSVAYLKEKGFREKEQIEIVVQIQSSFGIQGMERVVNQTVQIFFLDINMDLDLHIREPVLFDYYNAATLIIRNFKASFLQENLQIKWHSSPQITKVANKENLHKQLTILPNSLKVNQIYKISVSIFYLDETTGEEYQLYDDILRTTFRVQQIPRVGSYIIENDNDLKQFRRIEIGPMSWGIAKKYQLYASTIGRDYYFPLAAKNSNFVFVYLSDLISKIHFRGISRADAGKFDSEGQQVQFRRENFSISYLERIYNEAQGVEEQIQLLNLFVFEQGMETFVIENFIQIQNQTLIEFGKVGSNLTPQQFDNLNKVEFLIQSSLHQACQLLLKEESDIERVLTILDQFWKLLVVQFSQFTHEEKKTSLIKLYYDIITLLIQKQDRQLKSFQI